MAKFDFLMSRGEMTSTDLNECEQLAFEEDSILSRVCQRLLIEIRNLQHSLNDPNYQYSGRIHRNAILCREAQIDRLRAKIKELEAKNN